MSPQQHGQPVIHHGLAYGAFLALLSIADVGAEWWSGGYVATTHSSSGFTTVDIADTGGSILLRCLVFLFMLALTFAAGWRTARHTGTIGSGAVAGLLVGAIGGLVGSAVTSGVIIFLVAPGVHASTGSSPTPAQVHALLIGTTLGAGILGLILDIGMGAGMGALGGLMGAKNFRAATPMSMPSGNHSMLDRPNTPPSSSRWPQG